MKWTIAALAAFAAATGAQAVTVVTAAHMLDPAKGVTVDNVVVVIGRASCRERVSCCV